MNSLKQKIQLFMQGRYGYDSFSYFLLAAWMFFAFLNIFLRSVILYIIEIALAVFVFYRAFSRNTVKRQRENAKFYEITHALQTRFKKSKQRRIDKRSYRFFHCPSCKAEIRMPKKIGAFNIRCPRCHTEFRKEFKR